MSSNNKDLSQPSPSSLENPQDYWKEFYQGKIGQALSYLLFTIVIIIVLIFFYNNISLFILDPQRIKVKEVPLIIWYADKNIRTDFGKVYWKMFLPKVTCYPGNKEVTCNIVKASKPFPKADGFVLFASDTTNWTYKQRNVEEIWGLVNIDSPVTILSFLHEQTLNLFNFSLTFSRHSNTPLPLHWLWSFKLITSTKYYVNTSTKNAYLSTISPILYLQSTCSTFTNRHMYVEILMQYISVDSYGRCLNNKKLPESMEEFEYGDPNLVYALRHEDLLTFIAKYKFVIAIENAVCQDYVTESLWRAISVGVVPIYFGDPGIRNWLPNVKSAILLDDHHSPQLLSEYLKELLQNDSKYEEYLEHKTKGIISNTFLINEINARPNQSNLIDAVNKFHCQICERIHDKDSHEVSIVDKKHYNCAMPISALSQSIDRKSKFIKLIKNAKVAIDSTYYHT